VTPTRREILAALVGVPAMLACRGKVAARSYDGEIVGGDVALGHKLRTGELLGRPVVRRERVGTAILGGGISGLSTAWALARAGDLDFKVYELEPEAGGTARSGENAVSRYPWGAHYIPVPISPNPALVALLDEVGAIASRDADGNPVWAEEVLCGDPEERLFYKGQWHEGLFPRAGASTADFAELHRFEAGTRHLATLRDSAGRRAFALPLRLSSPDFRDLDAISMQAYLERNGFTSERLRWFVEYGCRDDFGSSLPETSAWAGLHYYAARLAGEEDDDAPAPFLTWPEGNGRVVARLARASVGRLVTRALVFDAAPHAAGVTIRYLDAARDEVVAVEAADAVFALPKLVASRVVAPYREKPPAFLSAFSYVPWLVANLTLRDRPREHASGFMLCWDNVLFDSRSLGYVVATHQGFRDRGATVFTYYLPFAGEDPGKAREKLFGATHAELAAAVMADLSRAHRDLPDLVTRLDIYRWGHAMARPAPGFVWGEARQKAAEPVGRLRFAHTDLAGLPLFEEAQDVGVRAAEAILRSRGARFSPLT